MPAYCFLSPRLRNVKVRPLRPSPPPPATLFALRVALLVAHKSPHTLRLLVPIVSQQRARAGRFSIFTIEDRFSLISNHGNQRPGCRSKGDDKERAGREGLVLDYWGCAVKAGTLAAGRGLKQSELVFLSPSRFLPPSATHLLLKNSPVLGLYRRL